jgi:FtsP/CotA-like multicopper oxidase with cupredoxin domain
VHGNDSVFGSYSFPRGVKMTQIGNDSGFLSAPASLRTLNLAPGERADVIVDFSSSFGQNIVLQENGGDAVQFRVTQALSSPDTTADPTTLNLAAVSEPGLSCGASPCPLRKVALAGTLLGTVNATGTAAVPKLWDSPTTENPTCLGSGSCGGANAAMEDWDIYNFGGESHPIHLHEVRFQVLGRASTSSPGVITSGPTPGETGRKDTVVAKGHTVTKIRVRFDFGGLYAWHCHMTSHEDDEMMRPVCVVNSVVPCNAH